VASSFKKAKERRDKLETDADFRTIPVGVVLDNLRNHAQQLRTELQKMMNQRHVLKK